VRRRDERIRAEVKQWWERLEDLEGRLAAIEVRLNGARIQELDSAAALEAAKANVIAARRRAESFEEARRALDARHEDWERRSEDLRAELGATRQNDAAARSRLQTLEGLRERYEGFDPGVRALMLAEGRDPGVRGTVGDLLRLPADWVPALEPALSTVWQVVVVDDTGSARRLVGRLKDEALGYATLIPLDRVPAREARGDGLVWASEVIETDPAYRGLVRYLFGDLALVDDLDEAMRVVGEGRARRAATRAGQLVDGAAMAGGEGGPAGAELVERLEGLDRCRHEIDGLMRALGALTRREQTLREEREVWERDAETFRIAAPSTRFRRSRRNGAGLNSGTPANRCPTWDEQRGPSIHARCDEQDAVVTRDERDAWRMTLTMRWRTGDGRPRRKLARARADRRTR
jgi:chromosome segregation protein